jgi:hypothetical protein
MGLEDLFGDDHKKHRGYRKQKYNEHQRFSDNQYKPHNRFDHHTYRGQDHYTYNRNNNHFNLVSILEKLSGNRKLKSLVIGLGLLLVVIVIILIVILLPLIVKLFSWVGQNGLQGLIDNATTIIDKFLNGTK